MASMEEAKMNIRALLESSPHGILLNKVCSEYKSVVGLALPFQQLGYGSVQELFNNIPDTAIITPSHLGPLITCVANEKTKHIEQMVRTQKANVKSRQVRVPKTAPVQQLPNVQSVNRGPTKCEPPSLFSSDIRPLMGHAPNRDFKQHSFQMPKNQPSNHGPRNSGYMYNGRPCFLGTPNRAYLHHPPQMHQPVTFGYNPVGYAQPSGFPMRFLGPLPTAHNPPTPLYYQPYRPRSTYYEFQRGYGVPKEIQNVIVTLLEKYPRGLTCGKFSEILSTEFHCQLFPDSYGFTNNIAMLSSLTSILTLRNTGSQVLVYPAKRQRETCATSSKTGGWESSTRGTAEDQKDVASREVKVREVLREDAVVESPKPDRQIAVSHPEKRDALAVAAPVSVSVASHEPRATQRNVDSSGDRMDSINVRSPILGTPLQAEALKSTSTNCVQASTKPTNSHRILSEPTACRHRDELYKNHIGNDEPAARPESGRQSATEVGEWTKARDSSNAHDSSSSHIGESIKTVFKRILEANPGGIWASELITLYKQYTGHRLNFRELGFYSIHELVVSIPDVFNIRKSKKNSDWLLECRDTSTFDSGMDSSSQDSGGAMKDKRSNKPTISISQTLKIKMLQVICSCPNGTVLSDFEILYKRLHNEDFVLNYSDNYYTSEAVFLALSDLFEVEYINDTKIIVRPTTEGKRFLGRPIGIAKHLPSRPVSYPDDVVVDTPTFKTQSLPTFSDRTRFLRIRVTYVMHPGQFWIQLHDPEEKLATLMYQMKMLYHDPLLSKAYIMPDGLIAQNRVCAALYPDDQNWYRAIITSLQAEDTVQVYYVDFGNQGNVHRSNIRFLKKQFMTLPTQALMAKLRRIVPAKQGSWSQAAKTRFLSMSLDKDLVALVAGNEAGLLSLCLADTSGEEEINLNTTLVEEGLAAFECLVNQPLEHSFQSEPIDGQSKRSCESRDQLMTSATNSLAQLSTTDRLPESVPRSCSMIESARNIQLEEDDFSIIPTLLSNNCFHIVRMNGIVYVPTFEISALFWNADILKEMIALLNVPVTFLTIEKESRPNFFQQLLHSCAKENRIKTKIFLCPLERMPDILLAIASGNKELHNAFVELLKLHKYSH